MREMRKRTNETVNRLICAVGLACFLAHITVTPKLRHALPTDHACTTAIFDNFAIVLYIAYNVEVGYGHPEGIPQSASQLASGAHAHHTGRGR